MAVAKTEQERQIEVNEAAVGFLGCATREIAQHFGKYFAKEIFDAKYGDTVKYQWIR